MYIKGEATSSRYMQHNQHFKRHHHQIHTPLQIHYFYYDKIA